MPVSLKEDIRFSFRFMRAIVFNSTTLCDHMKVAKMTMTESHLKKVQLFNFYEVRVDIYHIN